MVDFDKAKRVYTVTFKGDVTEYFYTVKTVLRLIEIADKDLISADDLSRAAAMVSSMLPGDDQNINLSIED